MSIAFGGGKRSFAKLTWAETELPDEDGEAQESEQCAICLDALDGDITPTIACGHVFHTACRTRYLRSRQPADWVCPVCREQMFVSNAERTRLREPEAWPEAAAAAAAVVVDSGLDVQLSDASFGGYGDEVQRLLAAGANVHADDDIALMKASENGQEEVVQLLLAAGANVHARDDWALWSASRAGHAEVLQLLLAAGANVHANDDWALLGASRHAEAQHAEVVRLLLAAGRRF